MKKIRKSVWETNSSSSHSIVIERVTLKKENRTKYVPLTEKEILNLAKKAKKSEIDLYLDEYGWGYDVLTGFTLKLEYVVAELIATASIECKYEDDVLELIKESGLYDLLKTHLGITKYTIRKFEYCYIDHQSVGTVKDLVKDYGSIEMLGFLLDDRLDIVITNDNRYDEDFDETYYTIYSYDE